MQFEEIIANCIANCYLPLFYSQTNISNLWWGARRGGTSLFKWYWIVENFTMHRCAQIVEIWIRHHPCATISPLYMKDTVSSTIVFPYTFSSQRPFQCSRHSLSIFEFIRTEYPINGYMVIHDPSSNTVNNILMLGHLSRSMLENVFYDRI